MPSVRGLLNNINQNKAKFSKTLANVAIGVAIFLFGVAIGSGELSLNRYGSQNANLPENLDYSSIEEVYDALRISYDGQLDINKLLEGLKHGLVQATGDPYTSYLTAEEASEFRNQLNGTFQGIGAELSKDEEGNLIVVAPIDGFPAEKAGLKPQDIIISVDGEPTLNMSVDQAVAKIRGPSGTDVVLKVIRSRRETLDFTITRAQIKISSVESKVINGNIGYIKINEFSSDTGQLAQSAANKLQEKGAKTFILDLRGNPGGELNSAVEVAGIWLSGGETVLTTRRGDTVLDTYKSKGNGLLGNARTVVLIDEGSASASEIVAGALKDSGKATLIGQKSFGKGSVQDVEDLEGGAILKVTIARWFTPSGKNIDKQGIEPDNTVKITDEELKSDKDPQLDTAIKLLTSQ